MSDAGVNDDPAGVPRVGIIGGGQLARMIAQAAVSLGVEVSTLSLIHISEPTRPD